jgi:N-hydroxyarylamine O-acetyltransferase
MQLAHYLARIGYPADARPDIGTLRAVMRAHICSVPFENLDVQLRRTVTIDVEHAFEKIVLNRRGGWCYEQNGLFGWALSAIGFDVTRVAAAVMRDSLGEAAKANHLSLLVRVPGDTATLLADVGFGGSLLEPIRLAEHDAWQDPFRVGLRRLDDGHWQFWEDPGDGESRFDFRAEPASEDALRARCRVLQTDPASSFVRNLVVQIRAPGRHTSLRGRVLTRCDARGRTQTTLETAAQLVDTLADVFQLDAPAIADCWPQINARHAELFGET